MNNMSNILKGKLGWKGEKGDSAYEISVKHGYTGTEEQWSEDFLNAENYYDKPEANALLATKANASDVYTKGDFAILTGFVPNTELSLGGKTIEYPEGFTFENTAVLCTYMKAYDGYAWYPYFSIRQYNDQTQDWDYEYGPMLYLYASAMKYVTLTNYIKNRENPDEKYGYYYRVVLMKIPTE
jgi:hypothetical protein